MITDRDVDGPGMRESFTWIEPISDGEIAAVAAAMRNGWHMSAYYAQGAGDGALALASRLAEAIGYQPRSEMRIQRGTNVMEGAAIWDYCDGHLILRVMVAWETPA